MKKVLALVLTTVMTLTVAVVPVLNASAATISSSDYSTALKDAIWFYDANKCGKEVAADNVFDWRSACHTTDGSDVGIDLTGGFHDCGDHIKFGITQGYAASILGWSLYEYKDAFDATGNTNKILSTLKYFTDYFLKCRVSSTKFYYHVGDPSDHDYWGPPEKQTGSRTARYYVDPSNPASDVCGLYSGALTIMYLNYKNIDQSYANNCLSVAKELYSLGKTSKGVCRADTFYTSSAWEDDMAWAAIWLYVAENNSSYLTDVGTFLPSPGTNWTICWNDMKLALCAVAAKVTEQSKYKDAISSNLTYWRNSVQTSPGGMKILNSWGTLRYSAAEALLALMYYKMYNDESAKTLAKSQIDYILGANPANMSYMIGFGNNYPKHPHHRAASGYVGWDNWKQPAQHVLTGALVGGPNASDTYTDLTDKYECSEVGIDYNAGLVGALAAMYKFSGNMPSNTPTQIPSPTETKSPTSTPTPSITRNPLDVNIDGAINMSDVMIVAQSFNTTRGDGKYVVARDLNNDGAINMSDIMMIAAKFNTIA